MVAVYDFNVNACVRHSTGDLTELSGDILPEFLHEYFANVKHFDTNLLERSSSRFAVFEEKVHVAFVVHHPTAAAFHAQTSGTESLAHASHLAGFISQFDRYVEHNLRNGRLRDPFHDDLRSYRIRDITSFVGSVV